MELLIGKKTDVPLDKQPFKPGPEGAKRTRDMQCLSAVYNHLITHLSFVCQIILVTWLVPFT